MNCKIKIYTLQSSKIIESNCIQVLEYSYSNLYSSTTRGNTSTRPARATSVHCGWTNNWISHKFRICKCSYLDSARKSSPKVLGVLCTRIWGLDSNTVAYVYTKWLSKLTKFRDCVFRGCKSISQIGITNGWGWLPEVTDSHRLGSSRHFHKSHDVTANNCPIHVIVWLMVMDCS